MDVREMLEKLGTRAFTLLLCFSSFKGRQELDDVHLLNMPHTLKHALSITYERILFQPAQTLFGALVLGVQLFVCFIRRIVNGSRGTACFAKHGRLVRRYKVRCFNIARLSTSPCLFRI